MLEISLIIAAIWIATGVWLGLRYLARANNLEGAGQRAAFLIYTTVVGFPILFAIGSALAVTLLWHSLLTVSNRLLNLIRRN